MSFESVYRVSHRNRIPGEEEINSLAMELPIGYRDYVTSFGHGTLCTFLIVKMPGQIRDGDGEGDGKLDFAREDAREAEINPNSWWRNVAGLSTDDFERALVFAYAAAEAPIWFATPNQGPRLFEYVEGDTCEIENGFFGLVERCAAGQQHEFPFFEPNNGRRRMRTFYVRTGVGRASFVEAMARRWGRGNLRCSRSSDEELYPHYFVSPIEGHLELHLDPQYNRLPGDSFFVRASYDVDSESELAAFVEPLLLPGGGPHEFTGQPIWLP